MSIEELKERFRPSLANPDTASRPARASRNREIVAVKGKRPAPAAERTSSDTATDPYPPHPSVRHDPAVLMACEIGRAKSGDFLAKHPDECWSLLFERGGACGGEEGETELPLTGHPLGEGWIECAQRDRFGRMRMRRDRGG